MADMTNNQKLVSLDGICKYFNVGRGKTLKAVDGITLDIYKGCEFASRCEHCMKICKHHVPPKYDVGGGHEASCWRLHPDFPKDLKEGN